MRRLIFARLNSYDQRLQLDRFYIVYGKEHNPKNNLKRSIRWHWHIILTERKNSWKTVLSATYQVKREGNIKYSLKKNRQK